MSSSSATPVDVWLTQWAARECAWLRSESRESTARITDTHVRLHLAPGLAGILMGDLTVADLTGLWRRLLDSRLSRKTVSNIRGTMSVALQAAVHDRIVPTNLVRDAPVRQHRGRRQPVAPKAGVVLDEADRARLIDWCVDNVSTCVWAAPLLLIAETGLRRGEALGLRWSDWDRVDQTITVRSQAVEVRVPGRPQTVEVRDALKTVSSARTVVVPTLATEMLHQVWRQREVARMDGLMFTDRAGGVLNPESFTQWVRKVLRPLLDLPEWATPHNLRHGHATGLLRAGVPVGDVSDRLGHSSTAITEEIYSHSGGSPADRTAADVWDVIVRGGDSPARVRGSRPS